MAITIGELTAIISANTKQFDRAMKGVEKEIGNVSKRSVQLSAGVKTLGRSFTAAAAVIGVTTVALGRFAQAGGKALTVQQAFDKRVGGATAALKGMTRATRGLVSQQDLMLQFNRAVTLGAAKNTKEFEDLAEGALALGRALGVDAAFALESLSLGIGRQSRLILDNLGLIVSVEEANRKYAKTLGVAASQLSEVQQKEAFRVETLGQVSSKVDELGGITLNAGDAWTQLGVVVTNVVDEMKKAVAQSGLLRTAFEGLRDIIRDLAGGPGGAAQAIIDSIGNVDQIKVLQDRYMEFFDMIPSVQAAAGRSIDEINESFKALGITGSDLNFILLAIEEQLVELAKAGEDIPDIDAPSIDRKALEISADLLARVRDRVDGLVEKGRELELDLQFEEDAEAAKKLQKEIGLVARELERVTAELLRQQLGQTLAKIDFIPTRTDLFGRRVRTRTGVDPRLGITPDRGVGAGQLDAVQRSFFKGLNQLRTEGLLDDLDLGDLPDLVRKTTAALGDFGRTISDVLGGITEGGLAGIGQAAVSFLGDALSRIFGREDTSRILRENTEAIRLNTRAIQKTLATTAGGTLVALQQALATAISGGGTRGISGFFTLVDALNSVGITLQQATAIADSFGFTLTDNIESWRELLKVLSSRVFDDFVGRMDLARRRIALLDIETPAAQFLEFQKALTASLPTGFGGLGTTVARLSPQTIDAFVRGILDQISAGTFDVGQLGGLSLEDFLNALGEMESLADAASGAADELNGLTGALRNAPAGFKVALSRFNATTPISTDGSARSNFNIDSVIVVANDPDEMRRGIEDSVRRESRRGGVTSLDLSVKPVARAAGL